MDSQILSELYYSIYEDQEVLDEGIVDALKAAKTKVGRVLGVSSEQRHEAKIKATKKARQSTKEKILSTRRKPAPGSRVNWDAPHSQGTTQARKHFKSFEEDYSYILEYLVTEGFVNTIEEAEVVFGAMSTDWIDEILSESI